MKRADAIKGLTIAAGSGLESTPEVEKERLILVGNCITKFKSRGRHVHGCPISGNELVSQITGIQASETAMGDALEYAYAQCQKKIDDGAPKGFDWNAPPE